MTDRSPDMLKPTLMAGALFGALAALPVIGLLNCACCALVIACGFFGAHLYSRVCRRQGAEFRAANGAVVGLISGAFYAMVHTLVSAIVDLTTGGDFVARAILEWAKSLPNLPPESVPQIDQALENMGKFGPLRLIMGFLVTLLIAAVFSTIGGLIGGAVFKVELPPPPPPAMDPPMTYPPYPGEPPPPPAEDGSGAPPAEPSGP